MTALTLIGVIAFYLLCFSLGFLLFFFYLYALVMGFYRAWLDGRIKKYSTLFWLALPPICVGFTVDLIANWTYAWWVFHERPRTPRELVTDRLQRYANGPDSLNKRRAILLCEQILDPLDPTEDHCKRKLAK